MSLNNFFTKTNIYDFVQKSTLFLIVFVNIICLHTNNENFSVDNLGQLHATNPLIWFFYLIIAALWIFAYQLEKYKKNLDDNLQKINDAEKIVQENRKAFDFVVALEQGNLEAEYNMTDDSDRTGQVLINLRNHLIKNRREEEIRKSIESQEKWISDGLAKFAEILRQDRDEDLKSTSEKIMSNLVKYIGVSQGALFLVSENIDQDDDFIENSKFFDLYAAFAFDRKKFLEKRIQWGEGLIGACVLEKQPIIVNEVSEDYFTIASGLGQAKPKYLFIVPLMLEEEVFGVIELASFTIINDYQQQFVEKLAESIAASLYSIRVNKRTALLLAQTQQQAANLATQEEELRQNMEELKAIQESLVESQAKTKMIFDNASDAIVTIDEQGKIDQFNPAAEKLFGFKSSDIIGENVKLIMPTEYSKEHDLYLKNYIKTGEKKIIGRPREGKGKTRDGKIFPIEIRIEEAWLNDKRMFVGILRDITERVRMEEDMKQQIEELRTQEEELRQNLEELETTQQMIEEREAKIRAIFENAMDAIITINISGKIEQFNPSAEKLFGYMASEVIGQNIAILMPKNIAATHDEKIQTYLKTGQKHIIGNTREEKGRRKDGSTFPIEIRVNEAMIGDKKIFVGMLRDITERKMAEEELNQHLEEMNAQAEEMRQTMESLREAQEKLETKDKEQEKEIEKLNLENQKKIEVIEKMSADQARKDAETQKLYETEIDEMFQLWSKQLDRFESKSKKSK